MAFEVSFLNDGTFSPSLDEPAPSRSLESRFLSVLNFFPTRFARISSSTGSDWMNRMSSGKSEERDII